MTAPTEDLTRIANNSRDAVAAAVNSWAEAAAERFRTLAPNVPVSAAV